LWDTGTYSNWMFGVANSIAVDTPLALRAGPGHWNDPDMLVVGQTVQQFVTATGANGLQNLLQPPLGTADNALSLTAMQTNLTMWAMLAAPLVLGDQVRYLTPAVAQILVNPSVIAVDQDPLGRQGAPISPNNWVWSKQLSGGSVAVALFNPGAVPTWEPANASEFHLPAASSYIVNNLWTGREWRGNGAFWANVPAQGAALFRVTAVPKPPPPKPKPKHGGSSKSQPGSGGSPGSGGVTVGGHSG
jgi:alpha-galactosidase